AWLRLVTGARTSRHVYDARAPRRAHWLPGLRAARLRALPRAAHCRTDSGAVAAREAAAAAARRPPPPLPRRRRRLRLGTGCMVRPQSSMSRHIPQFCGVLGHTFMEFLKGSGDYCQAQHDLYADK
ncbi:unnamed protein product, partial [Rangifer tarandus platyrhynchus]